MRPNWKANLTPRRLRDKLIRFLRQNPHLLDGSFLWNTADRDVLQRGALRYLEDHRELLGMGPSDPISLERPMTGARTLVFDVRAGSRHYLLRVFRISRTAEARVHYDASKRLEANGVNVPRIVDFCRSPRRYRAVMLLEEFIEGKSLGALRMTEAHLRAQARQLARLHSITRNSWGPLDQECRAPLFPFLVKSALRNLEQLRQAGAGVDDRVEQETLRWCASWSQRLHAIERFSLTHGDIHRANGIFTADGDYCLIDFTKFEFAPAARDVVRYRHKLCRNDAAKFGIFIEEYDRHLSPDIVATVHEFIPFYEALYSLAAAAAYSKRAARSPSNRTARERIGLFWQEFRGMVTGGAK